MLMDIKESLNSFIEDRTTEVSNELLNNDKYNKAGEGIDELFNQIKELLPEEYRYMLFEYDERGNAREAILQEVLYEQGLKDGINLNNILKLVV